MSWSKAVFKYKYPLIQLICIILTMFIFGKCKALSKTNYYGEMEPYAYLTGRFNPSEFSTFIRIDKLNFPTKGRVQYLRKEAAAALIKLYKKFRKDHPDIPFWVQSATRTYHAQKGIWEAKWNGRRTVNGQRLNRTIKDPLKKLQIEYIEDKITKEEYFQKEAELKVS